VSRLRDDPERYTPPYWPVEALTDYQVARLPRRDSVLLVGAMDLPVDSLTRRLSKMIGTLGAWTAGFIASSDPAVPLAITDSVGPLQKRYVFQQHYADTGVVVGLEVIGSDSTGRARGLHRVRFGLPRLEHSPATRLRASDLVLIDLVPVVSAPGSEQAGRRGPMSWDQVAPLVLGTTRLAQSRSVGLYWELTGATAGDTATMSVHAERVGGQGPGRQLTSLFGLLGGGERSGTLRWSAPMPATTTATAAQGWTVVLDLSALSTGEYELSVETAVPGAGTAVARRRVTIAERGRR
jgi:hypothetical protein